MDRVSKFSSCWNLSEFRSILSTGLWRFFDLSRIGFWHQEVLAGFTQRLQSHSRWFNFSLREDRIPPTTSRNTIISSHHMRMYDEYYRKEIHNLCKYHPQRIHMLQPPRCLSVRVNFSWTNSQSYANPANRLSAVDLIVPAVDVAI